ncbi:MAG: rhodanese-like domain-containing protein [Chloroflexota bacterium]
MPQKKTTRRAQARKKNILQQPAVQLGLLAVAVLAVVFIVLANSGGGGGLAREISVDEAYQIYQQGDAYFLDVRTVEEWNEYHAPDTTLIPLDQLAARVSELPKDRQIVVVCRSGNRSQSGRDILLQAGFTDVTSMAGGLSTWRDKGYPVTTGP